MPLEEILDEPLSGSQFTFQFAKDGALSGTSNGVSHSEAKRQLQPAASCLLANLNSKSQNWVDNF